MSRFDEAAGHLVRSMMPCAARVSPDLVSGDGMNGDGRRQTAYRQASADVRPTVFLHP